MKRYMIDLADKRYTVEIQDSPDGSMRVLVGDRWYTVTASPGTEVGQDWGDFKSHTAIAASYQYHDARTARACFQYADAGGKCVNPETGRACREYSATARADHQYSATACTYHARACSKCDRSRTGTASAAKYCSDNVPEQPAPVVRVAERVVVAECDRMSSAPAPRAEG